MSLCLYFIVVVFSLLFKTFVYHVLFCGALCLRVVCMPLHVCVCVLLYIGSLTQSTSMSHIEGVGKTWSKKSLG